MTAFKLIKNFSGCPPGEKRKVRSIMTGVLGKDITDEYFEELTSGLIKFHSIVHDKKIIAFVLFQHEEGGKECAIGFIWRAPEKSSIEFKKHYKTTPANYLIEELIRDGNKIFVTREFRRQAAMLLASAIEKGLIREKIKKWGAHFYKQYHITEKLSNIAHSREHRL